MEQNALENDRRMYQRIEVSFAVRFSYGAEGDIIRQARCLNISAGGICFLTEYQLPLYKKIKLWIEPHKDKEPLCAEGKVVWKQEVRTGMFRVGVNFDEINLMEIGRLL